MFEMKKGRYSYEKSYRELLGNMVIENEEGDRLVVIGVTNEELAYQFVQDYYMLELGYTRKQLEEEPNYNLECHAQVLVYGNNNDDDDVSYEWRHVNDEDITNDKGILSTEFYL